MADGGRWRQMVDSWEQLVDGEALASSCITMVRYSVLCCTDSFVSMASITMGFTANICSEKFHWAFKMHSNDLR